MLREIWTEDALSDVEDILDYLSTKWNQKIIDRFYLDLLASLSQIKEHPHSFQFFDKEKGIRTCLPNPHFRLFYKVIGNDLFVLRAYPSRKDPEQLYFHDLK